MLAINWHSGEDKGTVRAQEWPWAGRRPALSPGLAAGVALAAVPLATAGGAEPADGAVPPASIALVAGQEDDMEL